MFNDESKMEYINASQDEWPVCPFCERELRSIKYKSRGWVSKQTVFWCPHCRKLLGTSSQFNG